MLTLNDIVNKKFEKTLSGYRMDDVDSFFYQVVDYVTNLENEKNEEKKKLLVLANKIEEYRGEEESLKQAVFGAQKLGDNIIKEAKNRAEIIIKDATIKGEIIIKNKKDEEKKEQIILNKMKREVESFKTKMLTLYSSHIELLNSIPDFKIQFNEKDEAVLVPPTAEKEEEKAPVVEKPAEVVEDPIEEEKIIIAELEKNVMNNKDNESEKAELPVIEEKPAEPETDSEFKIASGFDLSKFEEENDKKVVSKFGPLKFGEGYDINDDQNKN